MKTGGKKTEKKAVKSVLTKSKICTQLPVDLFSVGWIARTFDTTPFNGEATLQLETLQVALTFSIWIVFIWKRVKHSLARKLVSLSKSEEEEGRMGLNTATYKNFSLLTVQSAVLPKIPISWTYFIRWMDENDCVLRIFVKTLFISPDFVKIQPATRSL